MRHMTGGKIYKDGQELHIKSPEDAIANKIGLLTEDRRGNGIVGLLSILSLSRRIILLFSANEYVCKREKAFQIM